MRKTFFVLAVLLSGNIVFAQNWIDVGLKGGYGLNLLYNKNIFDDTEYNHKFSGGYSFGGKIGLNLGEFHEITFDVMSSKFTQKFDFNITDTLDNSQTKHNSELSFQSIDLLLMYRNNNEGRYFEIGPYMSLISNGSFSDSHANETNKDVTPQLQKNGYGLALGFGAYMLGTENFGITFGARFNYQISDLVSAQGQTDNFPTNKSYDSHRASHPFGAMIVMEMNYDLGYLASAKCSKRRKIILF